MWNQKEFARRVRIGMAESGFNQLQTAKRAKIAQPMLSGWLTGRCRPTVEPLMRLARALNKPLSWLLVEDSGGNPHDRERLHDVGRVPA